MVANFDALVKLFFRTLEAEVRAGQTTESTLSWYRSNLAKVTAIAGDLPAADLRPVHLVDLTMTNALARAVKRVTRWAADQDIIPKDAFAKMVIPPCGERTRTMTPAELCRLYLASPKKFRRFMYLLRRTMARPGEIRKLDWQQVHLDKRMFVLTEFKAKKKRKDKARTRVIALDAHAVRFLGAWWRRVGRPAAGPLWIDRDGKPWSANAVRCTMRRARAAAGLDKGDGEALVCYTLRHTGATNAIRNGVELKSVSELLGHTRTSTTERYVHLDSQDLLNVIDRATQRRR